MVKTKALRDHFNTNFGKTAGERTFSIVNYLVFLIIGLTMLLPFVYVIVKSFEAYDISDGIMAKTYSLSAYKSVLGDLSIVWTFLRTLLIVFAGTTINVFLTILTAYPLSKAHLKGKKGLILFIVFPMLFSAGMVPNYLLIDSLGLKDNVLVYILPQLMSSFNIIVAKNFLSGIPDSLEESAKIDGAGNYRILFSIYLPLAKPIIATIALWVAVGKWNDYMTGLMYINNPDLYVIQNHLRDLLISSRSNETTNPDILNNDEAVIMANIVLVTFPVLIAFPFVQKHFIKGTILGSVKE